VRQEKKDALLVLAGDGDERESLERIAGELGLKDNLLMPGFADDLYPYYRAADLFVSSSRVEGMANVLLEAMAAGIPVIATRAAGSAEAFGGELTDWLVEPDDETALADRITTMLKDEGLRQRLGETAKERAKKDFSPTAMIDRLEEMLSGE
jgi:glycosyltransferase involved in cell wall biosynthesis